jgi:hypothetical protein
MKQYLLEALVANYMRMTLTGDATFVLQKLCSTLAALHQRLGSFWRFPLRHVCACLVQQHYVQQESLPDVIDAINSTPNVSARQLSGAVRLALTLVEDLTPKSGTSRFVCNILS